MATPSEDAVAELREASAVWEDGASSTEAASLPAVFSAAPSVVARAPAPILDQARDWPLYAALKRGLDVLVAGLAIVILAPLIALICMVIRLDSPGPALLAQPRVGRGGRRFAMYKLRTMRENGRPPAALLRQNEADGPIFKMRQDPRLTRVGQVLRKTSLDELPQLFNVLLGQMSLVGPRPPLEHEVERYGARERQRLLVPPGMTGLWQVEGRSDLPFQQMLERDLEYIRRRSLLFDLWILLRTVPAVLSMRGAY